VIERIEVDTLINFEQLVQFAKGDDQPVDRENNRDVVYNLQVERFVRNAN